MAYAQRQASVGSDTDPRYAMIDDKKRKRMLSNRESARRSRMKKQKQVEDLLNEVNTLQNENGQLRQRIEIVSQCYSEVQSANNILKAQAEELMERLQSLNSILQIAEENSMPQVLEEVTVDFEDILESVMEPWQLPCSVQPIMAPEMFQC